MDSKLYKQVFKGKSNKEIEAIRISVATAAMSAIISGHDDFDEDAVVESARKLADALLLELYLSSEENTNG